jgi:hypothetical protein
MATELFISETSRNIEISDILFFKYSDFIFVYIEEFSNINNAHRKLISGSATRGGTQ